MLLAQHRLLTCEEGEREKERSCSCMQEPQAGKRMPVYAQSPYLCVYAQVLSIQEESIFQPLLLNTISAGLITQE